MALGKLIRYAGTAYSVELWMLGVFIALIDAIRATALPVICEHCGDHDHDSLLRAGGPGTESARSPPNAIAAREVEELSFIPAVGDSLC